MKQSAFRLVLSILFTTGLLLSGPAGATSLEDLELQLGFAPADSTINVGESLDIDIVISGDILSLDAVYISAFSFSAAYDENVLSFDGYTVGPYLGDPLFDVLDFSAGDDGEGSIYFDVTTFLDGASLADLQPDSFSLATLSFTGIETGASGLSLDDYVIGLEMLVYFDNEFVIQYPDCLISVDDGNVNVVPEPATMLLFGAGLTGLAGMRRRKSKK